MVKLPPMISAEVRAQIAAPESVSRIGRAYAASSRPAAVAEPRVIPSGPGVSFAVLAAAGGESVLRGERLTMDDLASCLGTRREPDGFTPVVAPRGAAAVQQHWADLAASAGPTPAAMVVGETLNLHQETTAEQQQQTSVTSLRPLTFNELLERDREVPSCSSARTRHLRAATDDAKQERAARRFARQQLEARVGDLPSGDNGGAFNTTLMNATITGQGSRGPHQHGGAASPTSAHDVSSTHVSFSVPDVKYLGEGDERAKSPTQSGGGTRGSAAFLAPERYPEPTRAELWARRMGPGFYRTRDDAVSRRVLVTALAPPPVALRDQRRREQWKQERAAEAEALASLRSQPRSALSRTTTPGVSGGLGGSDADAATAGVVATRPHASTPAPRGNAATSPSPEISGSPAKHAQPVQLPTVAFGRSTSRAETRRSHSTTPGPLGTAVPGDHTFAGGSLGVFNELFLTGSVGLPGQSVKSIRMPRRRAPAAGQSLAISKASVESRRTYYAAGTPSLLSDIDAVRARVVYPRVQTVNLGGSTPTVPFSPTHNLSHRGSIGLGSGGGGTGRPGATALPTHPTLAVVPPSAATRLGDWIIAT